MRCGVVSLEKGHQNGTCYDRFVSQRLCREVNIVTVLYCVYYYHYYQ